MLQNVLILLPKHYGASILLVACYKVESPGKKLPGLYNDLSFNTPAY